MSRCRSIGEKLVLLAAGELEGPEQEQTARHVALCAECAARLAQIEQAGRTLDGAFERLPGPGPDFDRHVLLALRASRPLAAPRGRTALAVAALLLAFAAGWLLAPREGPTGQAPPAQQARQAAPAPAPVPRPAPAPRRGVEPRPVSPQPKKPRQIHDALCLRELEHLSDGAPERRKQARRFLTGPGRSWLVERLAEPEAGAALVAAARELLRPGQVGRDALDRWLGHPRREVRLLALALGARPRAQTLDRWLALGADGEAALLAAGPRLLRPPLRPALKRAALRSRRWMLDPAGVWLLPHAPLERLLVLFDDPAAGSDARARLLAEIVRRPEPSALALLLRAGPDAVVGLQRLFDQAPPPEVAGWLENSAPRERAVLQQAIEGHPRRALFLAAWAERVGPAGRRALIELARLDPQAAAPLAASALDGSPADAAAGFTTAFAWRPELHRAAFRKLLDAPDEQRRRLGLVGLALAGERDDLALLLSRGRRGAAEWNRLLFAAIARLAGPLAPAVLARHVARQWLPGRVEALERLVRLRAPARRAVLQMALHDPLPELRRAALDLLDDAADGSRVRELARSDSDPAVRGAAYRALARLRPPRAWRAIAAGLEPKEALAVRRAAASALGLLGDPAAIPALLRRLEEPALSEESAGALMQLSAHWMPLPATRTPAALRAYRKEWQRWLAAHPGGTSSRYLAALASADPRIRALAASGLAGGDPRTLVEAWRRAAPVGRLDLARALGASSSLLPLLEQQSQGEGLLLAGLDLPEDWLWPALWERLRVWYEMTR